jgi:hypothetical protein
LNSPSRERRNGNSTNPRRRKKRRRKRPPLLPRVVLPLRVVRSPNEEPAHLL